jgi:circadian clock protein KaiC
MILKKIDEVAPNRIVFDSVSEMRLLAETPLRYRKQILALKHALSSRVTTVLFLDDLSVAAKDLQIHSIAHGVILLSKLDHQYGGERRRLKVVKLRGSDFLGGYHDFEIKKGGIEVYPRMTSAHHEKLVPGKALGSGSEELNSLIGGGLDRGTSTLLIGAAGTGKSSLAMKFALSAAAQREKVAYFTFDETLSNIERRTEELGLSLKPALSKGFLEIQKVDPAELSPGAFASRVQGYVESGCKVVVIDSLNGYIQSMPEEQFLTLQLHELLAFLNNSGVVTIMTLAQQGLVGSMVSPVDLTYLADTVILTRFFEANGEIKKALSVIKKRTGKHETTIREFSLSKNGINVGETLKGFEGVLTGVPRYNGDMAKIRSDG